MALRYVISLTDGDDLSVLPNPCTIENDGKFYSIVNITGMTSSNTIADLLALSGNTQTSGVTPTGLIYADDSVPFTHGATIGDGTMSAALRVIADLTDLAAIRFYHGTNVTFQLHSTPTKTIFESRVGDIEFVIPSGSALTAKIGGIFTTVAMVETTVSVDGTSEYPAGYAPTADGQLVTNKMLTDSIYISRFIGTYTPTDPTDEYPAAVDRGQYWIVDGLTSANPSYMIQTGNLAGTFVSNGFKLEFKGGSNWVAEPGGNFIPIADQDLDMKDFAIVNLSDPRVGAPGKQDAVTRTFMDTAIAEGSMFQGNIGPAGAGGGVIDVATLPAVVSGNKGWYYVSAATFTIAGTSTSLDGEDMTPGSWLQSSGDPLLGLDGWQIIPVDILSKVRADKLYDLDEWADDNWEEGSMVISSGMIFKASIDVATGEPAPAFIAKTYTPGDSYAFGDIIEFPATSGTYMVVTNTAGITSAGATPGSDWGPYVNNWSRVNLPTIHPTPDSHNPIPGDLKPVMRPDGTFGIAGFNGTVWTDVEPSRSVFNGSGAPQTGTHVDGDFYIDIDNRNMFSFHDDGQGGGLKWYDLSAGNIYDASDASGGSAVGTTHVPGKVGQFLIKTNQAGYPIIQAVSVDGRTWKDMHPARFKYDVTATAVNSKGDHPMQATIGFNSGRSKVTHYANRNLDWTPTKTVESFKEGAKGVEATNILIVTQAEFNAMPKLATTLYFIKA